MIRKISAVIFGFLVSVSTSYADEAEDAFVESNVLSILYHELGHAVIDRQSLAVLGQEEDAADVFSILMIDRLFEDIAAQDIAYAAAHGFAAEAAEEPAYWDVHGPDEQRFYNLVCIFYGADPDTREGLAEELGLPQERAEGCPDEFALANDSWSQVIDELKSQKSPITLHVEAGSEFLAKVLTKEIQELGSDVKFEEPLEIILTNCGEANAFYDLESKQITFCSEFEKRLRKQFSNL